MGLGFFSWSREDVPVVSGGVEERRRIRGVVKRSQWYFQICMGTISLASWGHKWDCSYEWVRGFVSVVV